MTLINAPMLFKERARNAASASLIAFITFFTAGPAFAQRPKSNPTATAVAPVGPKCISHDECVGDQVCVNNRCTLPANAKSTGATAAPVPAPVQAPPPAATPAEPADAPSPQRAPEGSSSSEENQDAPFFTGSKIFIAIERAFGAHITSTTFGEGDTESKIENVSGTLLWGGTNADAPAGVFQAPRLGFDVRVYKFLTVGGFAAVASSSTRLVGGATGEPVNDRSYRTTFAIGTRVGAMFQLGRRFVLWPRLGLSYASVKDSDDDSNSQTRSTGVLNLEGMMAFPIIPNVAVSLAPSIDYGLGGSVTAKGSNADISVAFHNLSATAGVLVGF